MAGRAPDTYSPILSAVIKIARFMVVQKATEMVMERLEQPQLETSQPADAQSRR